MSDASLCLWWNKTLNLLKCKSLNLKRQDAMLPCCQERYILSGYREIPSSFSYCLKSAVHPTNETMNFWTHFIPLVWLLSRHKELYPELNEAKDVQNSFSYPFIAYSIGCFMLLAGSSFAHLFNSLSPTLRHICFCCDYGAISAYSIGASVAYYYYISPPHCHGFQPIFCALYLPVAAILIIAAHALCCHTRFPGVPLRYVVRTLAYATPFILVSMPALFRLAESREIYLNTSTHQEIENKHIRSLYTCQVPKSYHGVNDTKNIDDFLKNRRMTSPEKYAMCHLASYGFFGYYILHLLCFSIAAIFNVTRYPEKQHVGKFDIIGNSHQWFHVFIAIGVIMQSFVIEEAMLDAIDRHSDINIPSHFHESNMLSTVGVVCGSITVSATIVVYYGRSLGKLYQK